MINQCTTSRHRMKTTVTQPLKSRNMYLLFGSIFVFVAGFAAYFKSKHNFSHIISVILYELKYNAVGAKALLADIVQAKRNKIDLPKKSGKVAVITGGSRGIGSEVVKMLLECDMEVIIACRTPEAGDRLLCSLRESGITSGSSKVYELDNSSLESVRKCAELIKKDYNKIDILINNAGIMFTPYSETVDGFEQQWAVNYLSHFLFTSLLMPLLVKAGRPGSCSRIVNVSSCAHLVGTINFVDINYKENFITSAAYGQSKLAQVMFTKSIQELFSRNNCHVEAYAVHPGLVNTELFDNTYLKKSGEWIMNLMFKNPRQGATPIVYAAVSDVLEGRGGMYISNCGPSSVNEEVNNSKVRQNLFEMSLHQTRLKDFLQAS